MAWINCEIVVSGETVNGQISKSNDSVRISIPFVKGVEVGSTVTADGKDFKIKNIVNVGDRDETLTLGADNGEQISRRAKNKSK
jgi:ribosomal protein L21